MTQASRGPRGFLAAGLGAFVVGVGSYWAYAQVNPYEEVTTKQLLTLGEKAQLGFEGLEIIFALFGAGVLAVVGAWLALWLGRYPFAFLTAVVLSPAIFIGGAVIEELESSWGDGPPSLALWMAVWPFVAGVIARAVVAVMLRERVERPADARPRIGPGWAPVAPSGREEASSEIARTSPPGGSPPSRHR